MQWKPSRDRRFRQLLARLTLVFVVASISGAGFVAVGNRMFQERLNDVVMGAVSTRSQLVMDRFFAPFFDFASSASLWMRIGSITSIGNPEEYVDVLHSRLTAINAVSSMSLADRSGRELVIHGVRNDGFEWYETTTSDSSSLIGQRVAAMGDDMFEDVGQTRSVSMFRSSGVYALPRLGTPGVSVRFVMSDGEGEPSLSLWLDLPLSAVVARFQDVVPLDDTYILFGMPPNDFTMVSLSGSTVSGEESSVVSPVSIENVDEYGLLQAAVDSMVVDDSIDSGGWSFRFGNQDWHIETNAFQWEREGIVVATLFQMDVLWISDLYAPLRVVVGLLFGLTAVIGVLLVRSYRVNAREDGEGTKLKRLIADGESSSLELKSSLRWDYQEERRNRDLEAVILKSIAAFSNAQGGTLLIGVSDEGHVLGLEPDYSTLKSPGKDSFELHLRNLIATQYGTTVAGDGVAVRFPIVDGKEICRVDIRKGSVPLYTTVSTKGASPSERFYVRTGNASRAIENVSEVASYVVQRFSKLTRRR